MSISFSDPTREDIFSITFIDPEDETIKKNTWTNWHLVPTSRPLVNPPTPKTNYVDIPGADGSLDYTEALSSVVHYGTREGSWEFYVAVYATEYDKIGDFEGWYDLYNDILNFLHGKKLKFTLDSEDSKYVWYGRLTVQDWKSDENWSKITIGYVLSDKEGGVNGTPNGSTALYEWKWNELFGNFKTKPYDTIYYGPFDVDGTVYRNFFNPLSNTVNATIKNTSAMTATPVEMDTSGDTVEVTSEGNVISMPESGNQTFVLQPGDNFYRFEGHGTVSVDYVTGETT